MEYERSLLYYIILTGCTDFLRLFDFVEYASRQDPGIRADRKDPAGSGNTKQPEAAEPGYEPFLNMATRAITTTAAINT